MKHSKRQAFTLIEIMIVVAIISLLAAIAVPNFLRARERSQATRVLEDLRILDSALDQYAMETNKVSGATANFVDLKNYIKTGSTLYATGADIFGTAYGPFTIDHPPIVATSTFNALSDVAPAAFWSTVLNSAPRGLVRNFPTLEDGCCRDAPGPMDALNIA